MARTDNNTDMRYLINMDYSFDLNINTMGRRIRTRLYFSSESHLHTILNVLRFTRREGLRSLLSDEGFARLNATPELCYLTQFVMRVFEDSRRDISDPKRFRVEMLFSPGATATPFHMNEMDREADASRFDTAPFVNIGREDLTCQDVEDFFEWAIQAGRSDDNKTEEYPDITLPLDKSFSPMKGLVIPTPTTSPLKFNGTTSTNVTTNDTELTRDISDDIEVTASGKERSSGSVLSEDIGAITSDHIVHEPKIAHGLDSAFSASQIKNSAAQLKTEEEATDKPDITEDGDNIEKEDQDEKDVSKLAPRKFFWSCVAITCFTLGVACLATAVHLSNGSRRRRQWS